MVIEIYRVVLEIEKPLTRRAVGIVSQFRHGDRALQIGTLELVLHSRESRNVGQILCDFVSAPLNDKSRYGSVNESVLVAPAGNVVPEISHRQWRDLGKQLQIDAAHRSVKPNNRPARIGQTKDILKVNGRHTTTTRHRNNIRAL